MQVQSGTSAAHDDLLMYAERVGAMAQSWSPDEIARQIALLKLKPGNTDVRQATLEGLTRAYREKTGLELN